MTHHLVIHPVAHCNNTTLLAGLLLCLTHTVRHPVCRPSQKLRHLQVEATRGGDDGSSGLPAQPAL